jgi:hypothetical protein
MRLDHIKTEKCPVCGSAPVMEAKDKQHCSGEWNEERKFRCGYRETYSPNSGSISSNECPNSVERAEALKKRKEAKKLIIEYISSLDVDMVFLDKAKSEIKNMYVSDSRDYF